MTWSPDICIYHAPCQDGFTAAWAIWRRWPSAEFVPGIYGEAPPDVAGKRVLIVDFSFKKDALLEMGKRARSIIILDHHKTAKEDLGAFPPPEFGGTWADNNSDDWDIGLDMGLPVWARFDMNKSGAMLAWEFAHPGIAPPEIVQHVQDRDLWRFKLPNTREIAATLFSEPYDFELWSEYAEEIEQPETRSQVVGQGAAIERKHHKDIAELLGLTARRMVIGGHSVPVANLPYTMSSDAANTLAEGEPFGACYFDNGSGKRVFSLRSKEGGADVSAIAAAYGGGGHARASGFSVPLGWEGDHS